MTRRLISLGTSRPARQTRERDEPTPTGGGGLQLAPPRLVFEARWERLWKRLARLFANAQRSSTAAGSPRCHSSNKLAVDY